MATKRLSPFQEHCNPHKTTQTHSEPTGSSDKEPENNYGKSFFEAFESWDPASVNSDNTLPEESPYTEQFFSDIAKTIIHTFPFRKFAKQHGCKIEDVFHAIRATVVEPLSKPACAKAARHAATNRIAHVIKATESTKSKSVFVMSTATTSTSIKSPELRRSAKRRKTMAPSERQLVVQDVDLRPRSQRGGQPYPP